jgi:hypothetical protein
LIFVLIFLPSQRLCALCRSLPFSRLYANSLHFMYCSILRWTSRGQNYLRSVLWLYRAFSFGSWKYYFSFEIPFGIILAYMFWLFLVQPTMFLFWNTVIPPKTPFWGLNWVFVRKHVWWNYIALYLKIF